MSELRREPMTFATRSAQGGPGVSIHLVPLLATAVSAAT
jgi:hypothetical protein